jgi:hypothetical protein
VEDPDRDRPPGLDLYGAVDSRRAADRHQAGETEAAPQHRAGRLARGDADPLVDEHHLARRDVGHLQEDPRGQVGPAALAADRDRPVREIVEVADPLPAEDVDWVAGRW